MMPLAGSDEHWIGFDIQWEDKRQTVKPNGSLQPQRHPKSFFNIGQLIWNEHSPPPATFGYVGINAFIQWLCTLTFTWCVLVCNKSKFFNWWFQPLWKMLVSWDHYSQYMENNPNVPNHRPVFIFSTQHTSLEEPFFYIFLRPCQHVWPSHANGGPFGEKLQQGRLLLKTFRPWIPGKLVGLMLSGWWCNNHLEKY